MKKKLLDKRKGLTAIEIVFIIFILFSIISIFIKVIPVYVNHAKAEFIARELVREISLSGSTSIDAYTSSLIAKQNVETDKIKVSINPKNSKLSIDEKFFVEVTIKTEFKVLDLFDVPFEIKVKDQGRGEVYSK